MAVLALAPGVALVLVLALLGAVANVAADVRLRVAVDAAAEGRNVAVDASISLDVD